MHTIDLGTCNSCVSVATNDKCNVVPVYNQELLPSLVDFTDPSNIKVGSYARTNAISKGNVVEGNKRILGKKFDDDSIKDIKGLCQAEVRKDDKGYCCYYIPSQARCVSPEDVNAELIKVLYNAAIESQGYHPNEVWITIPASFTQLQKNITRRSAEKVITEPVHFLSEPSAAAIQFGHTDILEDGYYVVYDLGGGTFDVCIIRVQNNQFEIVGTDGHPSIGGKLFDKLILDYVAKEYKRYMRETWQIDEDLLPESMKSDRCIYEKSMWKILKLCEDAKKKLSTPGCLVAPVNATDYFEYVYKLGGGDHDDDEDNVTVDYECQITRDIFEAFIRPHIQSTIDVTLGLLDEKGISMRDVKHVLLVGGSSNIPLVQSMLKNTFGEQKIGRNINCDNCVSKGAALRGLPEYRNLIERRPLDISSYDIAVQLAFNRYSVLIPKGSRLPFTGSKTYRKNNRDLDFVMSSVYEVQGKDQYSLIKNICVRDDSLFDRVTRIRVDYTLTAEAQFQLYPIAGNPTRQ